MPDNLVRRPEQRLESPVSSGCPDQDGRLSSELAERPADREDHVAVLALERCRDTGSAYGLVIEYGGNGAKVVGFVSDGATHRALQMVGNDAEVEIEIRNFAGDGRPVLLGVTERLEFVDAPGHAADLARYRARGYAMQGNRIAIVVDRPQSVVEVHGPSANSC